MDSVLESDFATQSASLAEWDRQASFLDEVQVACAVTGPLIRSPPLLSAVCSSAVALHRGSADLTPAHPAPAASMEPSEVCRFPLAELAIGE
jgi:hypothetical protein